MLQIGVPMMLNDHPAVIRLATILVVLLVVYTLLSLLFFRALARSRNR
jgi:membrane-anchored glycerophosphoryl diester phosphodiesterase (GDPDase)